MASDAELLVAARGVAGRWAAGVSVVEPIVVSENAVFRVETVDGDRFVLRLHRPGYNTPAEMESEVRWVQALLEAGVPVAQPRATLDGGYYVPVDVTASETRQTGAVEWIEGRPLGEIVMADHSQLGEVFSATGRLAAQLRRESARWEVPDGFVRRRWDSDGLLGDDPLWGRFWDAAALSDDDRPVVIAARNRLRERFASLPLGADSFGLIHADLHVNNVMRTDDGYVAIDFDDAGFGWFVWDVAVAFQSLGHTDPPPAVERAGREAFISGYRAIHPLSDDEVDIADAMCIARSLNIIGWMDDRPEVVPSDVAAGFARSAAAKARVWMEG